MTKKTLLAKLRAMEREAQSFEDKSGFDADNNATLELAHEMRYQITEGKGNNLKEYGTEYLLQCAIANVKQTYADALDEARAEIEEAIE